jgi:hypothetical protein
VGGWGGKIIVSQDAHRGRFSEDEMNEFVPDGDGFLTTISKR